MTPNCAASARLAVFATAAALATLPTLAQQPKGSKPLAPILQKSEPQTVPVVDPFEALAASLAGLVDNKAVSVGVGNFAFENTELLSPFSSLLRDELESALGRAGKFKVISRDRLADLQNEGKFQARDLLEPGTGVSKVFVEGIQGIVRGRFYASPSGVSVFAELVWLEGATIQKTKVELPVADVRARIWPDRPDAPKGLDSVVRPQNLEASAANVLDVTSGKLKQVAKEFPLEFYTVDTRRAFQEGEVVSFRVRSDRDCYVAVYCHQSDGSSVLLFPNHWQKDAFVPVGKAVDIPGTHKHGFEIQIGPPFGSDVVQAIACTDQDTMMRLMGEDLRKATAAQPFATLTRGMAAVGISGASTGAAVTSGAPAKWSESHIVVSTFPKTP
jgi:hypothetical protein